MTDVLNRPECFHCGRPVRWEGSDTVCRNCHDKWGEPTIEQEMHAEGSEDGEVVGDGDEPVGVVTDTSTDDETVTIDIDPTLAKCPDCGDKTLTVMPSTETECSNCGTKWVPEEDDDD